MTVDYITVIHYRLLSEIVLYRDCIVVIVKSIPCGFTKAIPSEFTIGSTIYGIYYMIIFHNLWEFINHII